MVFNLPQNTSDNEWIVVNLQHAGFYRVNYDDQNWDLLTNQLNTNHTLIESTNRAVLLDDSYNLGKAEIIKQTTFLNVTRYLVNEEDPSPFEAAFHGLEFIHSMLINDQEASNLFTVIS